MTPPYNGIARPSVEAPPPGLEGENTRGPSGIPKRVFQVGLGLHVAFVLAVGGSAWAGALPALPGGVPHLDVVLHFVLIGMVAFFLDGALGFRPLPGGHLPWLRLGPALVLAVAAAEELSQALSPLRSASFLDLAADVLGILSLSWLARRLGSPRG